jgi:hypothetical protein
MTIVRVTFYAIFRTPALVIILKVNVLSLNNHVIIIKGSNKNQHNYSEFA